MPRNLFERCEVVFPVRDAAAKARIHDEILPALLADTSKARLQQPDGSYLRAIKVMKDAKPFSSQDFLMELAEGKADLSGIPQMSVPKPAPKLVSKRTNGSGASKKAVPKEIPAETQVAVINAE